MVSDVSVTRLPRDVGSVPVACTAFREIAETRPLIQVTPAHVVHTGVCGWPATHDHVILAGFEKASAANRSHMGLNTAVVFCVDGETEGTDEFALLGEAVGPSVGVSVGLSVG